MHNKFPFAKPAEVSIKKPCYTMASTDGESAEIVMYGDIVESQPVDWWTGEPVPGQYIILSEFLDDLVQISKCKEITIRMNSYGGDAGVSNTIHNRLRELSRDGTHLTCVVDGVAMSGGSLIMCACDTVRANPSSLIMIHKGWTFLFGGYNADEMREQAQTMDAWDKMQVEIYKRKTGLSEADLLAMMAETTYMTGREAKEKGFVDELLEDAEPINVAASADGKSIFVAGRQMHLAPGMFAPDEIPTVNPKASAPVETNINQPVKTGTEGGHNMTPAELRAAYPEEVAAIEAEARASADNSEAINTAVNNERARIMQIDEIAPLYDEATIHEAKYGENPKTAQQLAFDESKKAAQQGKSYMKQMAEDTANSGASSVEAVPGEDANPEPTSPDAKLAQARAEVKAMLGKN